MKTLCDIYNNAVDKIIGNKNPELILKSIPRRPSVELARHIIHQAYVQAVTDPDRLNDYEPFSPQVYGETKFDFIKQMIEEIGIKDQDTFIDLGSGVGQGLLNFYFKFLF